VCTNIRVTLVWALYGKTRFPGEVGQSDKDGGTAPSIFVLAMILIYLPDFTGGITAARVSESSARLKRFP